MDEKNKQLEAEIENLDALREIVIDAIKTLRLGNVKKAISASVGKRA